VPITIDDAEDGDIVVSGPGWSGWTDPSGSLSASPSNPIAGSFSLALETTGTATDTVSATRATPTDRPISFAFRGEQTSALGDDTIVRFLSDGSQVCEIRFNHQDAIRVTDPSSGGGTAQPTTWNQGAVVNVTVAVDDANDEYRVEINGTGYGPYETSNNGDIDEIQLENSFGSTETATARFDGLTEEVLGTPTLSLVDARATEMDLSWTDVADEAAFEVYSAGTLPVTTSDTLEATVGADTTTDTVTGLASGQQRFVAVRAVAGDPYHADGALSAAVRKQLASPTLSIDSVGATSIDASWTSVADAADYELYVSQTSPVTTGDTLAATTASTSATASGLAEDTQYYLAVRATDSVYQPSPLSNESSATTGLQAPDVDSTTAVSETAIDVDYSLNDGVSSGTVEIVDNGTVVETRQYDAATETQITGLSEGSKHDIQVRRVTSANSTSSNVSTQYTQPAPPSNATASVNELPATATVSYDDNSTGEDAYEVERERDGGAWTTATTIGANTTTVTTGRLDRTSTYRFRVRATVGSGANAAASAYSTTTTLSFPSYQGYWAVVTETDGTATLLTDAIESGPSYEHTALHGFTHALRESDVPFADWGPLTELEVLLDEKRLFFGELVDLDEGTPTAGATTVDAHGPAQALTRTAPSSKVTFENVLVYEAIEDYLANQVSAVDVSGWIVKAPPGEIQADGTLVLSDQFSAWGQLTPNVSSDQPVDNSGSLLLLQVGYINVQDDFELGNPVVADSPGNPPYHIDGEYADLGNNTIEQVTITPDHDIPEERVTVVAHLDVVDGAGTASTLDWTLNGDSLDPLELLSPNSERWVILPDAYSGGDLTAGSSNTMQLSTGDYQFNLDAMGLVDSAYGPYTFDDVEALGEKITGPKLYKPVTIDLATESRTHTISDAAVAATVTDTSGAFGWEFTTTGGASSLTASSDTATFDFFAASQFGTTLAPSVTLDGYGSNSWLADGATGQEITSLDISVTTVDVASVSSIELTGSHFKNLKRLHDQAGMRWVVDPTADRRVDGIVAESFAPDSAAAERSHSWTQLSTSRRRQMEGYANAVTVNYIDAAGNDQSFQGVADADEVSRVGREVRKVVFAPQVQTNDQARNRMLNERRERIARDRVGGTVEIAAEPVLPGYRYDIADFGGYTSLERTRYVESADRPTATLQFERDDDVARLVSDTQATVDTIQERL